MNKYLCFHLENDDVSHDVLALVPFDQRLRILLDGDTYSWMQRHKIADVSKEVDAILLEQSTRDGDVPEWIDHMLTTVDGNEQNPTIIDINDDWRNKLMDEVGCNEYDHEDVLLHLTSHYMLVMSANLYHTWDTLRDAGDGVMMGLVDEKALM